MTQAERRARLWPPFRSESWPSVRIVRVLYFPGKTGKVTPRDGKRESTPSPLVDVINGVEKEGLMLRVHVLHALGGDC